MDSLNISNLDCPQFVCFETEILRQNKLRNGLQSSPSHSSIKDYDDSGMVVGEQDSTSCEVQDQSMPSHLFSSCSSSNSNQLSPGGYSLRSKSSKENYPVNFPVHLSLPDDNVKMNSRNKKDTKVHTSSVSATPKRKREDEYVPMAEMVAAFEKTPKRFRNHGPKAFQSNKHWSPPSLTQPISPNLQAGKRVRGTDYVGQEEKEAMEVEEMKKYRFRARPVKNGILQKRQSLKGSKKPSTKPQDMQLQTAKRAAQSCPPAKEEEKFYEFHAKPVPTAIFKGPTGIKKKPAPTLTDAKTPNFNLKKRAEKWKSHNHMSQEETIDSFKAQPIPIFDAPFEVKHEKKIIEVQPFSFESRDKERMMQKERKIMEEIERSKVYEFKAQPMPSPAPSKLPAVPKKPATEPEPFNFHFNGKYSNNSSLNSTSDQAHSSFKAQPATVLKKPPFVPEKSAKQPVEVQEFQLQTDIRASKWAKLKEQQALKEQEKDQELQRLRLLQEEEEQREIARIRKEAVHKANPVRIFKPLEIKPSSKPPTQPVSPKFKTSERLLKKQESD